MFRKIIFSLILLLAVCTLNGSTELVNELLVYDEPAAVYHGCWKRAWFSETNGWQATGKFYDSTQNQFDENDHIRRGYSYLITALHYQKFLKFGDIQGFRRVAATYENAIEVLGTKNHPLVAYTYLQYINFINKHSGSRKVDELAEHVGNVICYLNAHWNKPEDDDANAITCVEVESYKVLSMFYASYAKYLYRKGVTARDDTEKNDYLTKHDQALRLAEEKVKMALQLCADDKQREILEQKHLATISAQKESTGEVRDFSFKTVAYVGAVEEHIDRLSRNFLGRLEGLLVEQEYLPIFHTQIPWFKPIVSRKQNIQRHFSQQQELQRPASRQLPIQQVPQQPTSEQLAPRQSCMCHDCDTMRSQIFWHYQNVPSEFTCDDHFHFEVSRFAEVIDYFHSSFMYIDDAGKNFILETLARLTRWPHYLSAFESNLFTSIESRIKASIRPRV